MYESDLGARAANFNIQNGFRLNANGGAYEINQENLFTGYISASSTDVVCEVTVTEYE